MKKVYAIDIIDIVFFGSIAWLQSVYKAVHVYFQEEKICNWKLTEAKMKNKMKTRKTTPLRVPFTENKTENGFCSKRSEKLFWVDRGFFYQGSVGIPETWIFFLLGLIGHHGVRIGSTRNKQFEVYTLQYDVILTFFPMCISYSSGVDQAPCLVQPGLHLLINRCSPGWTKQGAW